ncbi:MAG: rhodanese-like domain-containing protein [Geopsychrobacter sp.]|nr:rhodanese-like domain-containing protein [Geopsychrobacter sp.]
MKKIILISTIVLLLPCIALARQVREISPKRVYDLVKEGSGLWLIDVRPPAVFARGHVEGSLNIPSQELAAKSLPQNKILILVDNSLGQLEARKAAEQIVRQGAKKVFVLAGGVRGWQLARLPFVSNGNDFEMARVFPGELEAARKQGVALDLYDLRTEFEREQSPLDGVIVLSAKTFSKKLALLRKELSTSNPGVLASFVETPPGVGVLRAMVRASSFYQQYLWDLAGDVRVLEAAFVAGKQGQTRKVSTGGCATCPGG